MRPSPRSDPQPAAQSRARSSRAGRRAFFLLAALAAGCNWTPPPGTYPTPTPAPSPATTPTPEPATPTATATPAATSTATRTPAATATAAVTPTPNPLGTPLPGPSVPVAGYVVDVDKGTLIPGAVVRLSSAQFPGRGWTYYTSTGIFHAELPIARWVAVVTAPGYISLITEFETIAGGVTVTIRLRR